MSFENPLTLSPLIFPVLECIHIIGFAFSVGTVALVDFRLMGIALTDHSPAELWKETWSWTLYGLIAVIVSGSLLFSSDPDNYYLNYAFLFKMAVLLLAIFYNYTVVSKAALAPSSSNNSRRVGAISLALWTCVAFGGIFIGFIPPFLDHI